MSHEQLEATETLLKAVDECAMSLIFSDQSTQLRQGKVWITLHAVVCATFRH